MAKRIATCASLVALAMIFSYVEAILPVHFGVPGVKLGLANLVVVSGLYLLRPGDVFLISLSRILLSALLFGSGLSLLYSLAGGILSYLVMLLLKRRRGFSAVGLSIAGGVAHNIGQIAAAAWAAGSTAVFYYLPVLVVAGVFTGMLMGLLAMRVLRILAGKNI